MKNIKNILSIVAFSILFISCNKDNESPAQQLVYEEENFLNQFLTLSFLNYSIVVGATIDGDKGLKFKSKVKGVIKAVTLNVPQNTQNVTLKIWDLENNNVLGSLTTNYDLISANNNLIKFTNPIQIDPNKEYMLTIDAELCFIHSKQNDANIEYPKDCGNISILGYYDSPPAPNFPPNFRDEKEYIGDCGFIFQQTN